MPEQDRERIYVTLVRLSRRGRYRTVDEVAQGAAWTARTFGKRRTRKLLMGLWLEGRATRERRGRRWVYAAMP